MQDGICSEPAFPTHIDPPFRLEYRLGIDNFIAYWIYLACKFPVNLPLDVRERLERKVSLIQVTSGLCVVFVGFFAMSLNWPAPGVMGIVGMALGFAWIGIGSVLAGGYPKVFLKGVFSMPYRWLCVHTLRNLAKENAASGSLDTESEYRIDMTPEGVIQTAERWTMIEGRRVMLRCREERIAWRLIESVDDAERHIFLLTDISIPVMIPHTAFPDSRTHAWFLQLAQRYQEAEGVFLSTSPDGFKDLIVSQPTPTSAIQTGSKGRLPY
jgi:hypothetical protein